MPGVLRQEDPSTHWPASIAELMSSRLSEKPVSEYKVKHFSGWLLSSPTKKEAHANLWSPCTHTSTPVYTCMCIYTHTHEGTHIHTHTEREREMCTFFLNFCLRLLSIKSFAHLNLLMPWKFSECQFCRQVKFVFLNGCQEKSCSRVYLIGSSWDCFPCIGKGCYL